MYFDQVSGFELEKLADKALIFSKRKYLDFKICNDEYYIVYDDNDNQIGGFALRFKKNKIVELNLVFNFTKTGKEMIKKIIEMVRGLGYMEIVLNCYSDKLRDYYHENFGFMVYKTRDSFDKNFNKYYYEMELILWW
jgi:hypothetical protein